MREIKFRGKSASNGKWYEGDYITDLREFNRTCDKAYILPHWDKLNIPIRVDPETVGQYTGLKDKNGREIYEGDIVLIHQWNRKYEVIYESGMFKVKGNTRFSLCTTTNGELTCEVIRNIYENSELLEGEK